MNPLSFLSASALWTARLGGSLLLSALFLAGIGCQQNETRIQSYLEGQITVSADVDPSDDYSNFRVLVVQPEGTQIDTLGQATTDSDGRFSMTVSAPERDIYSLTVWGRQGQERLATTQYVVAPGDSGTLELELPVDRRPIRIESPENLALLGYQNTLTMHRRMMRRRLQPESFQTTALGQNVRLTSSILWSLQENYPGTYASQLAAVESLSLLERWNDSLVVERGRHISPSNPRYTTAVRILRNAIARRHGQDAVLDSLDAFEARAQAGAHQAGVQAIRIQAFLDSLQTEAALSAAQRLQAEYPRTEWAEWAARAEYEAENLMPGMTAPDLTAQTLKGDSLSLRDLRGRPVVLEYYRPGSDIYNRQLGARNALHEATREDSVAFVSISTARDSLVNRAFLNNQRPSGHLIFAPDGREDSIVTKYNVVDVPTRFLIDTDGKLVGEYPDTDFLSLRVDLTRLLDQQTASAAP